MRNLADERGNTKKSNMARTKTIGEMSDDELRDYVASLVLADVELALAVVASGVDTIPVAEIGTDGGVGARASIPLIAA